MGVELRLPLPQPDAQSIETLEAEAIAVTAGSWKQMTLTNIQEGATNEIDLAEVLPGATLQITRFSFKNRQLNIQAQLKGPRTVRQLEIQPKIPGSDRFSGSDMERSFRVTGTQATRTMMIRGYSYDQSSAISSGGLVLVVRYPVDLRRERVKFKLTGLDLL